MGDDICSSPNFFMNAFLRYIHKLLTVIALLLIVGEAHARVAEFYTADSKLSSGKWAKVKTRGTGMHLITDADLRQLGFTDPAKVHVFGRGGQQLSYGLTANDHDDLPLLPAVRTSKGLVFFAIDHFIWKSNSSGSDIPYSHSIHLYNDDSYYFVSDIPVEEEEMRRSFATYVAKQSNPKQVFTARLVHEKELDHPINSGGNYFGEDFRSQKSQNFNFTLPDMADDAVNVKISFASKTTAGGASLTFKANGKQLPSTAGDKIASVSGDPYMGYAVTTKEITGINGNLDLGITYSYTGALFVARLNYIEAFWKRKLKLNNGELHFYDSFSSMNGVEVSGCSSKTQIWDVTDPLAPTRVEYQLEGDKAYFTVSSFGYREFVAFDPESVATRTVNVGSVANQNLHALATPDMVIITLPAYRAGAERIAKLHEETDGMRVHVINAEEIYNEFSGGKKDFGAFRAILKMWYDRGEDTEGHKLRYCLLMGRPSYDNKVLTASVKSAGYEPLPIWEDIVGNQDSHSWCMDDLLGMLDDVEEDFFLENRVIQQKLRVAVGRLPVTSAEQALQMAAKIEKYVKEPDFGSWRSKVMIIADDADRNQHFDQAQKVYNAMKYTGYGSGLQYDRIYLDSYKLTLTATGATYPQATDKMLRNYDEGVLWTNYIGHASLHEWGHEHLWTWDKIQGMSNSRLPFIFAATCSFAYWDDLDISGAESVMLNPDAGVIGMIAAVRKVYIGQNGEYNRVMANELFKRDSNGLPLRYGDAYINGKNALEGSNHRSNALRYVFIGDPAIRIPGPAYTVKITQFDGKDVGGDGAWPELTAQSTIEVSGDIRDYRGMPVDDFDGTMELQLYDAERVVTTYGQGDQGISTSYNDRTVKLGVTGTTVKDGKWKATLRVPPEITNNYTSALIHAYASDGKGKEAAGNFEEFYIYGANENATADIEGPEIEEFYVNNSNFQSGDLVNSSPVIFARMSDVSGINISEGGIGHSLTLTVDGKDVYSDLNSYFTPDPEDHDAGSLRYPLADITPGKHTMVLTVWDNANNFSKASIDINVGAAVNPKIHNLYTNVNPASESVIFTVELDRPNTRMGCTISVYDLNGRKVWESAGTQTTDSQSRVSMTWDLCDGAGTRVPRGIYIYRAYVEAPEGTYSSKSKKLAVTAQ